jgi:hypothetical protein
MVHAHLCGRLPRDTPVVAFNPELPPSLLCMDVAYYFRCELPHPQPSTVAASQK